MRQIDYIILHHSATDYQLNGRDISGKEIAKMICQRSRAKWIKEYPNYKCDYHFLIGHTGVTFFGQPQDKPAWHATNYVVNLHSIGICFLGNFEKIKMPIAQFNAGVKLIKTLMKRFDVPLSGILRHKDITSDITHHTNSTLCPGKNFPYIEMLAALVDSEPFLDIGKDYPYLKELTYLKAKGIIKGDPSGCFSPDYYITREETALIAYRLMKLITQTR